MNSFYLHKILKFSNLNIVYFYLSVIYLLFFSNNIIKKKLKTKVLDLFIIVFLFFITCNNLIDSSYKLILLIIFFIFYNYQISYLTLKPSIIISFLYWYFDFDIVSIVSIIIKTDNLIPSCLYHILILIIFIFNINILLIPIIKKDIITKMSFPVNYKEYLFFSLFIISLFIFFILIFLFNISSISFDLIKARYILFLLNLSYVFYYIFFSISNSDDKNIEENFKESLDNDLILSSSAKQEDHIIKKINYYTRLYSCVMKSNTADPVDNYIYTTLNNLLNSFYHEYYTTDDIFNQIMSEKNLICDSLDIVFLLNIIKVDTSKVEKNKLKIYHTVLYLITDIVIIYLNRQTIKEKYIVVNIIDFSEKIYIQITSNKSMQNNNIINKIIDKNKIMRSDKYKYLNILVKNLGKKIKLNISDEKLNFIIK